MNSCVGPKGQSGARGATGFPGPAGPLGDTGDTGYTGASGLKHSTTATTPCHGFRCWFRMVHPTGVSGAKGQHGMGCPERGVTGQPGDMGQPGDIHVGMPGVTAHHSDTGCYGISTPTPMIIQGPPGLPGPPGFIGSTGATGKL